MRREDWIEWVVVSAIAVLGAAIIANTAWSMRDTRPPVPNLLPEVEAAERRAEHIYLVHVLSEGGETRGPWICEQANVGKSKPGGKR